MWNGLPIIIFGVGGMARETKIIIDDINRLSYENKYNILGYVSEKEVDVGKTVDSLKIIASDESLSKYIAKHRLIGAVIPIANGVVKKNIYEKIEKISDNIVYPNIISPKANIGDWDNIHIGIGNIICPGVTMTTNIKIGNFNVINMNSTVGHDVEIESFCTVNPLTAISGDVKVNSNVLLGAGTAVKQGVEVGENSIIGLGAFIIKNVAENKTFVCKPAIDLKEER